MTDSDVQRTMTVLDFVREHDAGRHGQPIEGCVSCERDVYREHSIRLNTIAWKLAVAVGDADEDSDQCWGVPEEQADRLISQLGEARRLLDEAESLITRGSAASGQEHAGWFLALRALSGELLPNVTEEVEIRG